MHAGASGFHVTREQTFQIRNALKNIVGADGGGLRGFRVGHAGHDEGRLHARLQPHADIRFQPVADEEAPLLMVIFRIFFLLPFVMGKTAPEAWAIIVALSFFTAVYMSQSVQAGNGGGRGEKTKSDGTDRLLDGFLDPLQHRIHLRLIQP